MLKTKLRVWPRVGLGDKWTVQQKLWWLPIWWTVGKYTTADMARLAIKEMEMEE